MTNEPLPPTCAMMLLPNCVLFPKILLPLRIFEERYRLMLARVLDGHGWLSVGLLKSERELDPNGQPDIFPVAGLGQVVDYEKCEDETFKIVVYGRSRVRVRSWIQTTPYPVAEIERFEELEPDADARDDLRGKLRSRIKELVRQSVDSQILKMLDETIKECEEIGPLVDSIAYHFLHSHFEKQRLLEISSAAERERLLIEILRKERFGDTIEGGQES